MQYWFDCETSGLDVWRNSIISVGMVKTDGYTILDKFYIECAPDKGTRSWSKEAEYVHGFNEAEQRLKAPPNIACRELLKFLAKDHDGKRRHLNYHANGRFDTRMLLAWMFKGLDSDYYEMYRYLHPYEHINTLDLIKKASKQESYKLSELAKVAGVNYTAHNALEDTLCLIKVCEFFNVGNNNHLDQTLSN